MKVTGIILAGGQGRRMGTEKGLTIFLGKPMIEHVLGAIRPSCDEILISANSKAYDYMGHKIIKDHFHNTGPLAGIIEGLKSSSSNTNIVVACDMPLVSASFIRCLLSFSGDYEITVPEVGDTVQPLCGIYKKSILHKLEKHLKAGEKRMITLIDNFKTNYVTEGNFAEFDLDTILQNFNSRAEIKNYMNSNEG